MALRFHRRVVLLAALSYALASTCSDLWHTHGEPLGGPFAPLGGPFARPFSAADDVAQAAGHDHCHAGALGAAGSNDRGGPLRTGAPRGGDHHDSCAACRFVAKSSMPSLLVAEPVAGESTHEVRFAVPLVFPFFVPADCLARAPPAVS